MIVNSKLDDKNIGLSKNLFQLRQELDVYCLIAANQDSINKKGEGKNFFGFLRRSCINLITLNICKIYECEKQYELDSIEGVLKHITSEQLSALDSSHIDNFIRKYDSQNVYEPLPTLSSTVTKFKKKYHSQLERFKTHRDKCVSHSESEFSPKDLPSYEVMECLFGFGADFYVLVSRAFISTPSVSIAPCDLNSNRIVKASFKKVLLKLGITDIKTELE